jgi:histidinol-phosphate aminotransferase
MDAGCDATHPTPLTHFLRAMKVNRRNALQAGIAISTSYLAATGRRTLAASVGDAGAVPHAGDVVPLRSAENPYGPPESALRALQAAMREGNRYPRTKIAEFKQLVANEVGLTPDHVIVGAGSIELMLAAGLYFGKLGRAVVAADPTWHTTAEYAEANGAKWLKIPLTKDYRYDFDRMRAAVNDDTALVYICHPNNPTGIAESHSDVQRFVQDVSKRTLVMVDEAFIDCLDDGEHQSMKHLVATNRYLIVSRTFSKLWGMAGFRVGYMLGEPSLMATFKATIPTLEMQSRLSVAAAIAAFSDHEFMRTSRDKMRESRKIIYEVLDKQGLPYIRSDCNFVTFEVPTDAEVARLKLLDRGVALKNVSFSGRQRLRVSCGTPDELRSFEQALAAIG